MVKKPFQQFNSVPLTCFHPINSDLCYYHWFVPQRKKNPVTPSVLQMLRRKSEVRAARCSAKRCLGCSGSQRGSRLVCRARPRATLRAHISPLFNEAQPRRIFVTLCPPQNADKSSVAHQAQCGWLLRDRSAMKSSGAEEPNGP